MFAHWQNLCLNCNKSHNDWNKYILVEYCRIRFVLDFLLGLRRSSGVVSRELFFLCLYSFCLRWPWLTRLCLLIKLNPGHRMTCGQIFPQPWGISKWEHHRQDHNSARFKRGLASKHFKAVVSCCHSHSWHRYKDHEEDSKFTFACVFLFERKFTRFTFMSSFSDPNITAVLPQSVYLQNWPWLFEPSLWKVCSLTLSVCILFMYLHMLC